MSIFHLKKNFWNLTKIVMLMTTRLPGIFCPYRNVHIWPAVIYARLGQCIIERVYKNVII
jgi:hypothetical protein